MLQNTNVPYLFLLCNIQVFAYYHFGAMLNNYYQTENKKIVEWYWLCRAHRVPVTKLNLTLPYNNFKTKTDINIQSFFPKKYYSSQALFVKFIFLSVRKRFVMSTFFLFQFQPQKLIIRTIEHYPKIYGPPAQAKPKSTRFRVKKKELWQNDETHLQNILLIGYRDNRTNTMHYLAKLL